MENNKPSVKFENVDIIKDEINALIEYYADNILAHFILTQAMKKIQIIQSKLKEEKQRLIMEVSK